MNELPSIDVIIPVYNAPVLTQRCIDSVVTYLNQSIQHIYIQNDASNAETRKMLEHQSHPKLHIHHAKKNQGFGTSVNVAIARSDADFVLVLNSDTDVDDDFLPLLCAAFAADPKLAVISPALHRYAKYDFSRYIRRPGGHIPAYHFQGHAFLIRRSIFKEIRGFDPMFGRGYFEDIDLGRRLIQQGWHIGLHPDARIRHMGGGSFGRGHAYRKLMQRNRSIYFARYPEARTNVLLVSGRCTIENLPNDLYRAIENVFEKGGNVHWLTPAPVPKLFCLHMRNSFISVMIVVRLMLRGWLRTDKRISTVWVLPGTSFLLRALLAEFIRARKLKVKHWRMRKLQPAIADSLPDGQQD